MNVLKRGSHRADGSLHFDFVSCIFRNQTFSSFLSKYILNLSFSIQCCSLNLCASTGHSKSKTRNHLFLEWGSLKVRGKTMRQSFLILSEIISRSPRVSDRVTMILPRGCWLQELLNPIWSLLINSSIYLFIYLFKKYVSCKYDVQNPVIDTKEK